MAGRLFSRRGIERKKGLLRHRFRLGAIAQHAAACGVHHAPVAPHDFGQRIPFAQGLPADKQVFL